jgi:hypothetical protein
MGEKRTMLDVARCESCYDVGCSAKEAARKVLAEVPADVMEVAREMAGALKAISAGRKCFDEEPPKHSVCLESLDAPSAAAMAACASLALARAREAGIEVEG